MPPMHCLHCHRGPLRYTVRRLCRDCHRVLSIRCLYPPWARRQPTAAAPCLHCGHGIGSSGRGLCKPCWTNRAIRRLYRCHPTGVEDWHEPTEAELEALIAEQLAKGLPAWWRESYSQDDSAAGLPDDLPAAVRRGRGVKYDIGLEATRMF